MIKAPINKIAYTLETEISTKSKEISSTSLTKDALIAQTLPVFSSIYIKLSLSNSSSIMAAMHFPPDISPSFREAGSQLTFPQKRSSDKPPLSPLQLPQHPTTHLGGKKNPCPVPAALLRRGAGGRRELLCPLETEGWVGTLSSLPPPSTPHPPLRLKAFRWFSLKNHERGGVSPARCALSQRARLPRSPGPRKLGWFSPGRSLFRQWSGLFNLPL